MIFAYFDQYLYRNRVPLTEMFHANLKTSKTNLKNDILKVKIGSVYAEWLSDKNYASPFARLEYNVHCTPYFKDASQLSVDFELKITGLNMTNVENPDVSLELTFFGVVDTAEVF